MRTMKKLGMLGTIAGILAAASAASAQDTIRVRNPKDGSITEKQGEVVTLTNKLLEYEIDLGNSRAKQNEDSRNVIEIVPDSNGRTFDFNQAELAVNNGEWDQAVDRFDKVRKDARARELLRQLALIGMVRANWNRNDIPGTVASAKLLRQERPESFYIRESFELEIKAHLAKNDHAAAGQVIQQFEDKGKSDGMLDWAKSAEVQRGRLLELQGKHREALAIHRKYVRDRDAGEEASLGELRCLKEIPNWADLSSRGEAIINENKGKKGVSSRLMTGAYNARGEAALNAGKVKDALLDFLQGALVLNKGGETSMEHEASLARGAVAAARLAAAEKDKTKKDTWKTRAQELLGELDRSYPGSRLRGEAAKEIQAVK
jgi:hypothetical protein